MNQQPNDTMNAARYALRGLGLGFLIGFALMHYGCEPRSFEAQEYFVFNLMGAMLPAIVGAIIGLAVGTIMETKSTKEK